MDEGSKPQGSIELFCVLIEVFSFRLVFCDLKSSSSATLLLYYYLLQ